MDSTKHISISQQVVSKPGHRLNFMSSFLSPGASAGCLYAVHCEDSAKVSITKFPPFVLSMAMVKSQLLSRSSLSSTIIGILPYEPLGPDELEPAEPRMGQIENR